MADKTTIETISEVRSHGGIQGRYRHASSSTGTDMTFSVFVPGCDPGVKMPVVWYLSGLTCTDMNVVEKGEYRAACAEHNVILVAPDTSPRGEGVPDDEGYDFGQGAGFYLNATEAPWNEHFNMRCYIEAELPTVAADHFPADMERQGIMGHSMGGHGALTIALRNSDRFKSVSAFSPIVAPTQCPWGEKALGGYLGVNPGNWREYDAVALIEDGARVPDILVDQGTGDNFLDEQLKPHLLEAACEHAGIDLRLRMLSGYDHSYYFISTFMPEHIEWHAARLK